MKFVEGGVCAAKGFTASGIHCGIRKNREKRDLALIYSEKTANAAAVYTTNLVKGAPLTVTKKHLANGMAENAPITEAGEAFDSFMKALNTVTMDLCRRIAGDGEGATKLLECKVTGAKDEDTAKTAAKSVICSSLVKAAMFGADANWGRVLCALGYSGADIDPEKVGVSFASKAGSIEVCKNGAGVGFSEELAKQILSEKEIDILVTLGEGNGEATAWGCDLTYDYVKINGDYRT